MKHLRLLTLVLIIAAATWFMGKQIEALQQGTSKPGVYKEAIDSAKVAVNQISKKTEQQAEKTITANDKMVTVYDGISVSENSETLNLSGKGLTGSLKAEVRMLTNLRELNISGNKFTGVPAEVGQLSKLEVLNLSHNPITGLPNEIGNLKNLKTLDLRGTNYAKQDLEVIKKSLPATTKILVD